MMTRDELDKGREAEVTSLQVALEGIKGLAEAYFKN